MITLASGTSKTVYPTRAPKLLASPLITGGSTTTAIASLNAAIDVIENLTKAGLATLGMTFFAQMIHTDKLNYDASMLAVGPDGKVILDYLAKMGVPDTELAAVLGDPALFAASTGGRIPVGLSALNGTRIAALRASVSNYVGALPLQSAITIMGAAVGGASTQGLIDGSFDGPTAVGTAFLGLGVCGVGLSLLP